MSHALMSTDTWHAGRGVQLLCICSQLSPLPNHHFALTRLFILSSSHSRLTSVSPHPILTTAVMTSLRVRTASWFDRGLKTASFSHCRISTSRSHSFASQLRDLDSDIWFFSVNNITKVYPYPARKIGKTNLSPVPPCSMLGATGVGA